MARAGSEALSGRYQFRLDLRDPQQMELARQLQGLEGGQRNRFIVERLTTTQTDMDVAAIKDALREVLLEFPVASPTAATPAETGRPPDDLFDTSLFT